MHDKIYNKVAAKYPELFGDMNNRLDELDKWVRYWNTEVAPVMRQIDDLMQNNYIQTDEKEKKLYELRAKLPELEAPYNEWREKDRAWRAEIQDKVDEIYKRDKKIALLWTPT